MAESSQLEAFGIRWLEGDWTSMSASAHSFVRAWQVKAPVKTLSQHLLRYNVLDR